MVQEILGNFFTVALVGHLLQGLELGSFKILRCQLPTVERVVEEFFHVCLHLSLRAFGLSFNHRFELLISDVILELVNHLFLLESNKVRESVLKSVY